MCIRDRTSSGDDKSDVGDEDMPEKMAKGVANRPKPSAKWPALSVISEAFSESNRPNDWIAKTRKQIPAIANDPTTNSVVITWNVAEDIISSPPNIHARTISIVPLSNHQATRHRAKVA